MVRLYICVIRFYRWLSMRCTAAIRPFLLAISVLWWIYHEIAIFMWICAVVKRRRQWQWLTIPTLRMVSSPPNRSTNSRGNCKFNKYALYAEMQHKKYTIYANVTVFGKRKRPERDRLSMRRMRRRCTHTHTRTHSLETRLNLRYVETVPHSTIWLAVGRPKHNLMAAVNGWK